MFVHRYRHGMTQMESNVIRTLRTKGYAVVVIPPTEVGAALNRSSIETVMRNAAKKKDFSRKLV
jgi:hypothetical protein